MTSNKGVFRVSRVQLEEQASGRIVRLESVAYSEVEGLRSRECNAGSPAGWRGMDGRLWFSTVKGVAVIDPAKLHPTPPSPATLVEGVLIDGHEGLQRDQLVIEPGATRIEIRYTGRTLIAPDRLRFRIRLEGFDKDWIDAGGNGSCRFGWIRL